MKNLILFGLLLSLMLPAQALSGVHAVYRGGTVTRIPVGTVSRMETASDASLDFNSSTGTIVIPYASIDSYRYWKEVTHHLGVLPAIAIGLLKARQHRHLFRISYRDQNRTEVVIVEVSKREAPVLEAILQTRVQPACKPRCPGAGAR